MDREDSQNLLVEGRLRSLGIDSLSQWDVLVFLYRHPTSLLGVDHIARILGYATEQVMHALDVLESVGFVGRSRVDQGVRLYQFIAQAERLRGDGLGQLLTLADSRQMRLALAKHLHRSEEVQHGSGRFDPDGHSRPR
jgi:hypothetical protein